MSTVTPANSSPPFQLESIQALRAFAAWLVVLYHLAETPDERWSIVEGQANWLHFYRVIGFSGVDLFFVISGVVMMVTCYHRFGNAAEVPRFLWRRATRVYPLYWFTTFAVLTAAWLVPSLAVRDKFVGANLVKSLVLWPQQDFPAVAVGWTLVFEMYFYLVFAALLPFSKKAVRADLLLWGAVTLIFFFHYDQPDFHSLRGNLSLPIFASPLTLEFLAGCLIGWYACERKHCLPAVSLWVGAALLLLVGYFVGNYYPDESQYGLLRVSVYGTAAALVVAGAVGLEQLGRWPRLPGQGLWDGLAFWGNASYSLYLSHVYVIALVAKLQSGLSPEMTPATRFAWTLVCLACCGLVAALGHLLVEQPLLRLFRSRQFTGKTPVAK
ncbi:MAG: acyltransferase [Lacipirellulaceae bacterium]